MPGSAAVSQRVRWHSEQAAARGCPETSEYPRAAVEGLAKDGNLHPIQQAFWDEHGLQCGFCTPGMMITALQILERTPNPTEDQIRHGLEGNLCRCTGYQHIVNAVQTAARTIGTQPAKAR